MFWFFGTLTVTTSLPTDEQYWGEVAPDGAGQFYNSGYYKGVYFSQLHIPHTSQLPLLTNCQPEHSMAYKANKNVGSFQLGWQIGFVQFPHWLSGFLREC